MGRKKKRKIRFASMRRRIRFYLQDYLRDILVVSGGIVLVALVAAAVSGYRTGNRGRVYAVNLKSGSGYQKDFQAGLMGVVNGVSDMEDYSRNIMLYYITDDRDDVLAGIEGVNKQVLYRAMMAQGTRKASELSYYASLLVENSHMSKDDYQTLLQIVEAEATGGDIMSKMIVAGVVLNRVRDRRFPDTVYDVVWQRIGGVAQFQPTQDGRIYNCEVTDSTIEAVDRVLGGEDYSQGALFFLARSSSEKSSTAWFDRSLVRLFEYGGHEYYTFAQ